MNDQEESELVLTLAKQLAEHFDAVEILVSRYDADLGTRVLTKGCGNWHTRYGLAKEYLLNCEEKIKIDTRRLNDEP